MARYAPYSHNRIKTYLKCPLAFYYSYVCEPDPQKPAAVELQVGAGLHRWIELYQKHLRLNAVRADKIASAEIAKQVASKYIRPEVRDEIIRTAAEVSEWFDFDFGLNAEEAAFEVLIAVKEDGTVCGYNDPDAYVRGKLDRVSILKPGYSEALGRETGRILKVADYKFWQSPNVEVDDQLILYAALILTKFEDGYFDDEVILEVLNMRYGGKPSTLRISQDEIATRSKAFLSNIQTIESDVEFKPTVSDGCALCSHRLYCTELKSKDGIQNRLAKYLTIKNEIGSLEKEIKAYVRENGNFEVSGRYFGNSTSEREYWEGEEIFNYLNSLGALGQKIALESVYINKTDMKRLAKKLKISDADLARFVKKQTIKHFGFIGESAEA